MLPRKYTGPWVLGTPSRRFGTTLEVAKAFVYLASDDSSYCSGTQIIMNGEVMAWVQNAPVCSEFRAPACFFEKE